MECTLLSFFLRWHNYNNEIPVWVFWLITGPSRPKRVNYRLSQHCKKVQLKLSCKTLSCFHDGQHEGIILQPNINLKFIRLFYTVRPRSSTGIRTFLKPHTFSYPDSYGRRDPKLLRKKDAVWAVSGFIGFFWTEGRFVKKKIYRRFQKYLDSCGLGLRYICSELAQHSNT